MNSGVRHCISIAALIAAMAAALVAQSPAIAPSHSNSNGAGDELKFVVVISRHGVRSPTGKVDQLNQYSAQPWPAWSVPPGYLTEHGAKLMTLFGAYDRQFFARLELLSPDGCDDANRVSILADSDQRTRETGRALAIGLLPGCTLAVKALPEGTPDPLFHSLEAGLGHPDKALATAALGGRIGNNPGGLTEAYRPQLATLEEVLTGCKPASPCPSNAASRTKLLFDIDSSIAPGSGNHLVELRTPLGIASTMTENMLLEYTEDMDKAQVGWGRVDLNKLRELLQLHTASSDIERRTGYIARIQSSNLLSHMLDSIEQAVAQKPVAGALSKPGDRLLILVGHDTNLSNISGALGLSWLIDGRRDDTPPGGALEFELWKKHGTEEYFVRAFYTAQTLDQMRNATPLNAENPPERVPVFIPACSQSDYSCRWERFHSAISATLYPDFVK